MSDAGNEQAEKPRLHCLDGAPAPDELGPSIMKVMDLDEKVRGAFPELVRAVLGQASDEQVDETITRICRSNELEVESAGTAIKASRYLVRQAAAFNVNDQQLGQDLTAIGCADELTAMLVGLYGAVLNELRMEIVQSTIVAHGNVLTGVEWRVDTLGAGNRGRAINVPIAMLTLHFRNGDKSERITLQALPDAINTLREVCENLLR